MATLFFDTSALIRRYAPTELGADKVRAACAPEAGNTLLVSRLLPTEVASALNVQMRTRVLTAAQRDALWELFLFDLAEQYQVVSLDEAAHALAETLLFGHALKAADALHLATALVVRARIPSVPVEFWTADRQQARAAEAEGLPFHLVA